MKKFIAKKVLSGMEKYRDVSIFKFMIYYVKEHTIIISINVLCFLIDWYFVQ